VPNNSINGNYSFGKATLTIYNDNTKAQIAAHSFPDSAALSALDTISFPMQPVFLSVAIQSGVLTFGKLWNNGKEYTISEDGQLSAATSLSGNPTDPPNNDVFSSPYYLPFYTLQSEGNTVILTFVQPFGSSAYPFPLEGKFVMTLVKQ
jgi:hypothetical protein